MIVHVYDIYYFLFIIYNNIVLHDADTADDTYWCLVPGTTCILTTTSKNHLCKCNNYRFIDELLSADAHLYD